MVAVSVIRIHDSHPTQDVIINSHHIWNHTCTIRPKPQDVVQTGRVMGIALGHEAAPVGAVFCFYFSFWVLREWWVLECMKLTCFAPEIHHLGSDVRKSI